MGSGTVSGYIRQENRTNAAKPLRRKKKLDPHGLIGQVSAPVRRRYLDFEKEPILRNAILPLSAACMLALGLSGTAWAQAGAPEQTTPPEATQPAQQAATPQSADFSDEDVAKFAQANQQVQDIQTEYTQKLQDSGGDQEQTASIQQEAQEKMVQAVESSGLGVEKYNQILQVAQADPELVKRIQAQQ